MSTTAELCGLLFPLLDLLHMPAAALVVLWEKPETVGHMGNGDSSMMVVKETRQCGINLPSFEFSFVAPPWPLVGQH